MRELVLNPVTVLLLLAIVACAVLAVRRMLRRGLCDCNDHCDTGCSGCAGCPHGDGAAPRCATMAASLRAAGGAHGEDVDVPRGLP